MGERKVKIKEHGVEGRLGGKSVERRRRKLSTHPEEMEHATRRAWGVSLQGHDGTAVHGILTCVRERQVRREITRRRKITIL